MQSGDATSGVRTTINVGEGCAGLILFNETPEQVQGLYTGGLKSGLAIIARGEKGIALAHDTGFLTKSSLVELFKKIGEIQFWSVAFNPNIEKNHHLLQIPETYKKTFGDKGVFGTKIEKINKIIQKVIGPEAQNRYSTADRCCYYPAEEERVYVDTQGAISTNLAQLTLNFVEEKPKIKMLLRRIINKLHNLNGMRKLVECDLEFDGKNFTPLPKLQYKMKELRKFAKEDPTCTGIFLQLYEQNRQEMEKLEAKNNALQKTYSANSLDHAFRKAAAAGNFEDVSFFVSKTMADINSQGAKSKKTALHVVVEKGSEKIENETDSEELSKKKEQFQKVINCLLRAGAKQDIKDSTEKLPSDYDPKKLFTIG